MYKLSKSPITELVSAITHQVGNILYSIPFDPANTDYAQLKKAISEETAQLEDVDGNLMTAQAAKDFIKELP